MEWIQSNSALMDLLFSFVVALSTVVYAVLTWSLVSETRSMRKLESEPALAVYITPSARQIMFMELVIHNHGRVPAREVAWSVDPDIAGLKERGVELESLSLLRGLSFLAPGREIRAFYGSGLDLFRDGREAPVVTVNAKFRGSDGAAYSSSFKLDPNEFRGITRVGELPEVEVARSLKKLADVAKSVSSGGRVRVLATTQAELDAHHAELRKHAQGVDPEGGSA